MPSDIQLRAVNGQELNVTGEVHLQVVVGGWRSHQRFVVTDSLNTGPVLGADFLSNQKMVVDFREQQLQWQGGAARLETSGVGRSKLCAVLTEDVSLDGVSRLMVPAKVVTEKGDETSTDGVLLLEVDSQLQKTEAVVARALVNPKTGTIPVQVMSVGTKVELLRGTRVGLLEEVDTIKAGGEIIATVEADQDGCAIAEGSQDKAEEYCRQLMMGFDWSESDLTEVEKQTLEQLLMEYHRMFVVPGAGISGLGRTYVAKHTITTTTDSPIRQEARRVPQAVRVEVDRQVEEM